MDRRTANILVAVGTLAALLYAVGGMPVNKILAYVRAVLDGAKRAGKVYNLPSWLFITAGGHESAMGLSKLALLHNNFFGFTADSPSDPWNVAGKPRVNMPTHEWVSKPAQGDVVVSQSTKMVEGKPVITYYVARPRWFRKYATPYDSFLDYGRLLTTAPRYAPAVVAARKGDIAETWKALGSSGYATDPGYGTKLAGVYRSVAQYIS